MSTENLLLREDGYPHLNSQSDEPTLIVDESGNPILEELAGNKMPANYSFECINNFVHCEDPSYEDLQCLALGMASKIRSLTISALPLPEVKTDTDHFVDGNKMVRKLGQITDTEALRKENWRLQSALREIAGKPGEWKSGRRASRLAHEALKGGAA